MWYRGPGKHGPPTSHAGMFVYNYRIYDSYDRPVASLAVLADDDPAWRPPTASATSASAAGTICNFGRQAGRPRGGRSRAAVQRTPSHSSPPRTSTPVAHPPQPDRPLRRQAPPGCDYSMNATGRDNASSTFSVLDWMMRLPREFEQRLWQDIENIEGERKVKYVTSVERLAIERGCRRAWSKGSKSVSEKGIEKQGRAQGSANVPPAPAEPALRPASPRHHPASSQSTPEQLEIWAERVLEARTIDEVFAGNWKTRAHAGRGERRAQTAATPPVSDG